MEDKVPVPEQKGQQSAEEKSVGLSEDYFAGSKLFSQALSQQSSHYIQSKLLALPK